MRNLSIETLVATLAALGKKYQGSNVELHFFNGIGEALEKIEETCTMAERNHKQISESDKKELKDAEEKLANPLIQSDDFLKHAMEKKVAAVRARLNVAVKGATPEKYVQKGRDFFKVAAK